MKNYKNVKNMKSTAIIAVLVGLFCLSSISANAQDSIKVSVTKLNEYHNYVSKLGPLPHDRILVTIDDSLYWKARVLQGFYFGLEGGAKYVQESQSFSYLAGLSVGYTMDKCDFLLSTQLSESDCNGEKYLAPSAYAEVLFRVRFGEEKKRVYSFFWGPRFGYQYTKTETTVKEPLENLGVFNYTNTNLGSALSVGGVVGIGRRQYMGGFDVRFLVSVDYSYSASGFSGQIGNQHETHDIGSLTKLNLEQNLCFKCSLVIGFTTGKVVTRTEEGNSPESKKKNQSLYEL